VDLVEEEDEDRLVRSPTSGSSSKSSASTHMRKVEKSAGSSPMSARSSTEDDPAAVRRGADQVGDLHLRLAEERVAALGLQPRHLAQQHPAVAVEIPPIALRSAFPGPEVGEGGAQVLQVARGRPRSSQKRNTRKRLDSWVSFSPRPSRAASARRP
jgi:hypothetical protein